MTSAYGLPRYVVTFLRHMEAHKDYLKWNITEGSHKITLTVTWNFKKHRGKESVWDKLHRLQRTLKLSPSGAEEEACLPPDVLRFLETSPLPKKPSAAASLRRHLSWTPFRRQMSWSHCSSFSLPGRGAHSSSRHSFHEPASPTRRVHVSPSRFSWPGTALDLDDQGPDSCTPLTSTPRSFTSSPDRSRARLRLAYRSEEEIERSLEDLLEKTKERTMEKLQQIKQEWDETVKNWPKILISEEAGGACCLNTSSDPTDSEAEQLMQSETVAKCLESCDKILKRDYMETPV